MFWGFQSGIFESGSQWCYRRVWSMWACPGLSRTTIIIYTWVTEVYPADLWGWTSRSSDTAPVCGRMVYLYPRCVWGVVKASAGNSIMLWMAHMSGALRLCSFTPRHSRGDHISMCGCSEVHWYSVCNLQDTFLGLPVTLFVFRAVW